MAELVVPDIESAKSPTTPSGTGAIRRDRAATLLVLGLGILGSLIILTISNEFDYTPWWTGIPFIIFPLAASIKLHQTATRRSDNERKAWLCFSIGCFIFACAEFNWMYYEVVLNDTTPSPSLGDVGYVSFQVLAMAGIWFYHIRAQSVGVPLAQVGNFGIILSAALLAYLFQYYELVKEATDQARALIAVIYGTFNGASLLFGLIVLSLYVWGNKRRILVLIVSGLAVLAATDFVYTYSILHEGYQSADILNGLYPLAFALIYLAAFEQDGLNTHEVDESSETAFAERSKQWETLVAPFAVAIVISTTLIYRDGLSAELIPFAIGPLSLFVVSLAMRNWWGHKAEVWLHDQALASKAKLKIANRELQAEIQTRSHIEDELRHSQKMEAVGQLTGGVAHDFNNHLAVIVTNLEIAEAKLQDDAPLRECLEDASAAALHATSLTKRLLTFSRKQALKPEALAIGENLEEMKTLLERSLGERIRVTIEGGNHLQPCVADRTQLESAILNLAINARDAMPDGGELVIRGSNVELDEAHAAEHPDSKPGSFVQISVRDTGSGIPAAVLSRVFEPFFTTKEVGAGTGLGLSMVYGFAKQSGGHLTIDSEVGTGTEVRLYLPSAAAQTQILDTEANTDTPLGRGETVFVVEDEPAVRKLVIKLLGGLGYEVIGSAADAPEAIALLDEIESVDLLFSDVVLPGGRSGADLALQVGQERPETRVLLTSGYAPESILADCPRAFDAGLLHKPFRTAELARAVRTALDVDR